MPNEQNAPQKKKKLKAHRREETRRETLLSRRCIELKPPILADWVQILHLIFRNIEQNPNIFAAKAFF